MKKVSDNFEKPQGSKSFFKSKLQKQESATAADVFKMIEKNRKFAL